MKKKFIAITLIGLMVMPLVVHSEELTSDAPVLSDGSFLEVGQEIQSDEKSQPWDEEYADVSDFEDDLTSKTVLSKVSDSDVNIEIVFDQYNKILNEIYNQTEQRFDKFALVYLNDNDIPDLIAHDPHTINEINVQSIVVSLDGVTKPRHSTNGTSEYKYYLEKGGYIIVEYTYPYVSMYYFLFSNSPNDYYLSSYYNRGAYVFTKHTYYPNYESKEISEEEFQSYINGKTQKDIPFVENTVENRAQYLLCTTPSVVLSKPSINGIYNSTKGADIRWKAVEGASGYEVYRKRGGEETKKVATIKSGATTQCYDAGVKDNCWGRVYNYYVIPIAGSTKGPKSDDVVLQRLAPMTLTSAKNTAAGKAAVTWKCSVNSNKANGYELQYAQSQADLSGRKGTYKAVTINGHNSLSKTISGLTKGKTYYFRVRCYVNYTNSKTGKTTKTWSQYSNVMKLKITK